MFIFIGGVRGQGNGEDPPGPGENLEKTWRKPGDTGENLEKTWSS